jgi:hypothetical protein
MTHLPRSMGAWSFMRTRGRRPRAGANRRANPALIREGGGRITRGGGGTATRHGSGTATRGGCGTAERSRRVGSAERERITGGGRPAAGRGRIGTVASSRHAIHHWQSASARNMPGRFTCRRHAPRQISRLSNRNMSTPPVAKVCTSAAAAWPSAWRRLPLVCGDKASLCCLRAVSASTARGRCVIPGW